MEKLRLLCCNLFQLKLASSQTLPLGNYSQKCPQFVVLSFLMCSIFFVLLFIISVFCICPSFFPCHCLLNAYVRARISLWGKGVTMATRHQGNRCLHGFCYKSPCLTQERVVACLFVFPCGAVDRSDPLQAAFQPGPGARGHPLWSH